MNVLPIAAFADNYIWAIIDHKKQVFDCIDPGDATPVLQFAKKQQLSLRTIALTHHHNDHIGGVPELIYLYPQCKVYGPNDSRIPDITHVVEEDDIVQIGGCTFHILSNPGHTATHISYYEPHKAWLFCGDTLFSAGCGRVFDGSIKQLHESMQLFKSLPGDTKVFSAHEYTRQNLKFAQKVEPRNADIKQYIDTLQTQPLPTLPSTMNLELKINPFLRTDASEVIAYALQNGAESSDSYEVFKVIREQKNQFKG